MVSVPSPKICCLLANYITHCYFLCFTVKGSRAMAFGKAEKARSTFQTDVLCGFSRDSTTAALLQRQKIIRYYSSFYSDEFPWPLN